MGPLCGYTDPYGAIMRIWGGGLYGDIMGFYGGFLFKHQKQNRIAEITYGGAPEAYFSGHEACQIQSFQCVLLGLLLNCRTW